MEATWDHYLHMSQDKWEAVFSMVRKIYGRFECDFGYLCKFFHFSTFDRMFNTFFFQLVHRQTQLSCTIHSLTSVCAHLTWIK